MTMLRKTALVSDRVKAGSGPTRVQEDVARIERAIGSSRIRHIDDAFDGEEDGGKLDSSQGGARPKNKRTVM
jgi:hypothetical protein